ncbi:MAG: carboxypeptidase-like regulatory domain-containing protein [Burkholderiales bacterium]
MLGQLESTAGPNTFGRLLSVSLVLLLLGCDSTPSSKVYSADPITAWVVDADTGRPIEGANVLAMWEMKYGLENHGTNYAMVLDAVTDAEGKFSLPGWGPKAIKAQGALGTGAPRFVILRYGYRLAMGGNRFEPDQGQQGKTKSDWDGKHFKMQKFQGSDEQYADYLGGQLRWELERIQRNGCHATEVPRFLLAMDQQVKELASRFPGKDVPTLSRISDTFLVNCGAIEPALRKEIR